MNQQQRERVEIAELKVASSEAVRREYAALPPNKRAAYAAHARKVLGRAEFDRIVASHGPVVVDPARAAQRAELDRAMGITTPKLGCRREGNSLIFGLMPTQPSAASGSGGTLPRAGAARQVAMPKQPTRLSAEAERLDRLMGFAPAGPAVTRSGSQTVFSARAAVAANGAK